MNKNWRFFFSFFLYVCFFACKSTGHNPRNISGCIISTACNFDANATIDNGSCWYANSGCACSDDQGSTVDVCGVCGGSISVTEDCPTIWNVFYDINDTLAGFQFSVKNNVSVSDATGGVAESAGFSISTLNNTVIGFSLSGAFILPGNGILVGLEIYGDTTIACIIDSSLVISGTGGTEVDAEVINCNTIH